jgi:hypothetical protein
VEFCPFCQFCQTRRDARQNRLGVLVFRGCAILGAILFRFSTFSPAFAFFEKEGQWWSWRTQRARTLNGVLVFRTMAVQSPLLACAGYGAGSRQLSSFAPQEERYFRGAKGDI